MNLNSARNGYCYNDGIHNRLEKYEVGDCISFRLDLDARVLLIGNFVKKYGFEIIVISFEKKKIKIFIGKNGEAFVVAFTKLPKRSTFHAIINLNDDSGSREGRVPIVLFPMVFISFFAFSTNILLTNFKANVAV